MSNSSTDYEKLCEQLKELSILGSIGSLLGWDERTLMPKKAGEFRAEEMTYLAMKGHEIMTSPELTELVNRLSDSDLAANHHSIEGTVIRKTKDKIEKQQKLPARLIQELTTACVLGQQSWEQARKDDDFQSFQPLLEKIVSLKVEEAQLLKKEDGCLYDALLDEFEPGESTENVANVLGGLRDDLVPLVAAIKESGREPDTSLLTRDFPVELQKSFGTEAAKEIGFEFDRGRLDVTAHPFCTTLGPNDIRILSRYDKNAFNEGFFGILHEAGHGIYEQGLDPAEYGRPSGDSVSLGIHESQSRLWENFVGRGKAFWEYYFPKAQSVYSDSLSDVSLDDWYFAINDVRPSLTRVESDEATYNLHIMIRFELEQALIEQELKVADLPSAWNEKYESYLGIVPPNDAEGVLQDIHWSGGAIGYFSTYSLGNLYAAQFFEQADKDLGGLNEMFAKGEFMPLREWLREKIHLPAQRYSPAELVRNVTGEPLSHQPLMRHLRGKYAALYGI